MNDTLRKDALRLSCSSPRNLHPVTDNNVVPSDDEPVYLRLSSARAFHTVGGGAELSEPIIEMTALPFTSWQLVKLRIKNKYPGLSHVLDGQVRLLYKGIELRPSSLVGDYDMDGGSEKKPIELRYLIMRDLKKGPVNGKTGHGDSEIGFYIDTQVPCTVDLKRCAAAALAGLLSGIIPRLTEDGTGATYLLRDARKQQVLGVFKPKDEEAFAPQNPRGYVGPENSMGLRQGTYSTQQAAREVAAHILDHSEFAGVPATTLVHAKHPKFVTVRETSVWKVGAFQEFVESSNMAYDLAPQVFSVSDVHRVGILDIRIVNLDRNDGNLLVRRRNPSEVIQDRQIQKSPYKLVPIDHGLTLPDCLDLHVNDLCWMSWPQAFEGFSDQELEYVRKLDGPKDARLLADKLGINRDCLRLLEVSTRLLQIGCEHGLTLYDLGKIICRAEPEERSPLERMIKNSLDTAQTACVSRPSKIGQRARWGQQPGQSGSQRQGQAIRPKADVNRIRQSSSTLEKWEPLTTLEESKVDQLAADQLSEVAPECTQPTRRKVVLESRGHSDKGSTLSNGWDEEGSIFSRRGPDGVEAVAWTPELESIFRRHIDIALGSYIRSKFPRTSAPAH